MMRPKHCLVIDAQKFRSVTVHWPNQGTRAIWGGGGTSSTKVSEGTLKGLISNLFLWSFFGSHVSQCFKKKVLFQQLTLKLQRSVYSALRIPVLHSDGRYIFCWKMLFCSLQITHLNVTVEDWIIWFKWKFTFKLKNEYLTKKLDLHETILWDKYANV